MRNQSLIIAGLITIVIVLGSCSGKQSKSETSLPLTYFENSNQPIQTGGVKMISIQTPKGKFNVWTKRIGNNPKIKLLLLNGGPGATHEYFECFENFLPKEGIEFIYYDQLACGNSDNPKDTSLFNLENYVEEVEQVRIALHLDKSNFFLLGHSWGGVLAMQYALKYQDNMKGLIISNMMASCPEYGKYADEVLAKQMAPEVLAEIRKLEEKGDYQNPRYMDLLNANYYPQHILRLSVWPEPVTRSFSKTNNDFYTIMQGPSEFGIKGKLVNWDVSKELKNIHVPTLVIGAKYDTMDPKYMEWMSTQIPHARFLLCKDGSHMCMYDDQQTYMNGLIEFLKSVN
ncbi:MAG: proline iminopeptidase-family hydrolase [Bacteroidales bacterium]|nr:proline iminopeptidase-family hydrolase [Bacteroidales bacterium]